MSRYNEKEFIEYVKTKETGHALEQVMLVTQYKFKKAAEILGVNYSTLRRRFQKLYNAFEESKKDECTKPVAAGANIKPIDKRKVLPGSRFFLTSLQNNTHVHELALKSVLGFCDVNDAQLLVGTFTYDKNSYKKTEKGDSLWYDPKLKPFIVDEQCTLGNSNMVWCGELNILPTAVDPLSGFESYTGEQSCVLPHTKHRRKDIAVTRGVETKEMYSTGTLGLRNYIQKTAGQKAEWHHIIGGVYVEIDDDGTFYARHINIDDTTGEFYDIYKKYTPTGNTTVSAVRSLTFGDLHTDVLRESVKQALIRDAKALQPEYIVCHDIHDHGSRNHHERGNPYVAFSRMIQNKESVEAEVRKSIGFLSCLNFCPNVVVVESNHDLALERWLKDTDYKSDPVNALFYLELQLGNYKRIAQGQPTDTFRHACELIAPGISNRVRFLRSDESFLIGSVEAGSHGDAGPNGARGSIQAFRKLGRKYSIGHSHTAGLFEGVAQAGASIYAEDTRYCRGPSSWSITSILQYVNDKRQLLTYKKGKCFL